jgi:AcrR family transcriptional regulator
MIVFVEKTLNARLAVQEAAIDLCLEHGYAATSTRMIAERADISERTLFRTFGTKAAIFWFDAFLPRVIRRLDQRRPPDEPVAALAAAVHATVDAITADEWRLELGRRKVILQEPDLVDAPPDRAFRTSLFARFAVAGFGIVPVYSDTSTSEWGRQLVRVVHLAANGPLTKE